MLKITRAVNGEVVIKLSGRMDAEPNRVGNANYLRSGRPPHRLGLKRSNPRGSRRGQFSQSLRSGQHNAQELPSIYPRVDHERMKAKRNSNCDLLSRRTT